MLIGCNKKKDFSLSFYVDETLYQTVKTNGKNIEEMPLEPEKKGYEFEGWFYDNDTFENEFLVDSLSNNPIKKNTSIYADFTAIDYTISYSNTKDVINSNPTTYNIETSTITLENLSKDGYIFEGWFIVEDEVTEITLGSTGNKSLEAKWTPIVYTATFKNGDVEVTTRTFTVEDTVIDDIPAVPAKDYYTNGGWESYTLSTSDITIDAVYTPIEYTISYTNIEGATNSNQVTYNVETATIALADPSKAGYIFEGWFIGETRVTEITLGSHGDKTIEAKWSLIEYTATFKNGTEVVGTRTFTVEDTVIDGLPTITPKDYYEGSWNYTITAGNIDVNVVYTPIDYTINYTNIEDATNSNPTEYNIETPTIALAAPSKDGYTFDGWFVGETKVTEIVLGSYGIKTLDAKWSLVKYVISYTNTKNAINFNQTAYNIETPTFTLYTLNKAGYTFEGWFAGETKVTEITLGSTGDKSLEAKWSLKEYAISYNLNEGTNNASNPTTYNIEDGTIELSNPTKKGKTFNGWEMNDEFVSSFSSSLKKDITLVATWIDEVVLTYTKDSDNNITIKGFANEDVKSTLRVLEIGETYDGCNVIGIASFAFYRCLALEKIMLPYSVEKIADYAFDECPSLTKVNYLGTIEQWCRITFGENIPAGKYTSNPLCNGASLYLNNVLVQNLEIPNTATTISAYVFSGCTSLASITIPDSVVSIGEYAFKDCTSLVSITIPNSVENIEQDAFSGCENLKYKVSENVNYLGNDTNPYLAAISVTDNTLSSYTLQATTKIICNGCFNSCKNLLNIIIPNSVKCIKNEAFIKCSGLKSITISDGVEKIEEDAFYECTSLTSVTIGNSVVSIERDAFSDCTSLKSIILPNSVESIGDYVFSGCTSLESIILPNSLKSIGDYAFISCNNLKYNVSENVNYLGNDTNPYLVAISVINKELSSYTLQDTTKIIYRNCFDNCSKLASITIPNSVESIGIAAFARCANLESVTILGSIKCIEKNTFISCTSLKRITIPGSVERVEDYAFMNTASLLEVNYLGTIEEWCKIEYGFGCNLFKEKSDGKYNSFLMNGSLVTEIEIPNTISVIKDSTFISCIALTSVIIPDSVESIGDFAFSGCKHLRKVYIESDVVANGITTADSFGNIVEYATTIYIEESITTIGSYIIDNYTTDSTTTIDGVTYNIYTKNS